MNKTTQKNLNNEDQKNSYGVVYEEHLYKKKIGKKVISTDLEGNKKTYLSLRAAVRDINGHRTQFKNAIEHGRLYHNKYWKYGE